MAITWHAPLQVLINAIGINGSGGGTSALTGVPVSTTSWLFTASNLPSGIVPYQGLTWASGPPQPDQWGVMAIVNRFAELGPWYDAGAAGQIASISLGWIGGSGPLGQSPIGFTQYPPFADLLQQAVNAASAVGVGPYTGTRPSYLNSIWPWNT
jgi:hypothetical protein